MIQIISILFTYILIGCLVAAIREKFRRVYRFDNEDKYVIVVLWPFYLIGKTFKFFIDLLVDDFFAWVIKKANEHYDNFKKNREIDKVIGKQVGDPPEN